MADYNPDFKQPPWVYGPKETMEWIESSHPSEKKGKKHGEKISHNLLRNMHIVMDLDAEQTKTKSPNLLLGLLLKITGNIYVEENFDLLLTAEIFLRALVRAKFKHNIKIIINKKIQHDYPELVSDSIKVFEDFRKEQNDISKYKILEIKAVLDDLYKCTADIKIKKIHSKKEHQIEIFIKGIIKEESYHEFLNYLNEKLKFKNV